MKRALSTGSGALYSKQHCVHSVTYTHAPVEASYDHGRSLAV